MSKHGDGDDGDNYVTRAECTRTSGQILEELSKHGRALYGEDGRGGIQKDISRMSLALEAMVTSNELDTKRLLTYVAATAAIIGPLVALLFQFILGLGPT